MALPMEPGRYRSRYRTAAFEVCHWSLQEIGSVNSQ